MSLFTTLTKASLALALGCLALQGLAQTSSTSRNLDVLILGDQSSEKDHGLSSVRSEAVRGGLGETARRLLPLDPVSYDGGSVSFSLKVDPERQNYVTIKLWGSDQGVEHGRLLLYLDGLQVGYRHEGDHDVLNQCDDDPLYLGRFVYQTVALPPSLTKGRTQVALTIAGLGRFWPYGTSFSQKQRDLVAPTRGIYRVYSHTGTRFEPEAAEKQGEFPKDRVRPDAPGAELLDRMRLTVNERLRQLMESSGGDKGRGAEGNLLLLAEAYGTPWTRAYRNERCIETFARLGDAFVRGLKLGDGGWAGAGPLGEALARLGAEPRLLKLLDETIEVPADALRARERKGNAAEAKGELLRLPRREAWGRALRASVDWQRTRGRRFYTNQSMIVDYYIYSANRGLRLLAPDRALPESQALRYLYEAVGLEPWLGNDGEGGSEKPYGERYLQITGKGLSRELGYVGTYGETILKFVRDMADLSGDRKIRQQLLKIQAARMYFRYPSTDADGFRVMKLASEIDSRTAHFPVSNGAYGIADVREAWWMELPAYLQDPVSVGAAQQCLADNQYFARLSKRLGDPDTLGMMRNIDDYAKTRSLPPSNYRLPMSEGQPDFVFSDEENAVLAVKHGSRRLFINFYYRQEFGVSGVVRILDVSPELMRIATVKAGFEVDSSGHEWVRPDVIDFERSGGFPPPGKAIHQAWKGEVLPIAKRPEDAKLPHYGTWGPFVGKAAFYWLRYGDYLIGVNTTEERRYTLPLPADATTATDLVSARQLELRKPVEVGPLSTVVLYLGR